jgi:hypothetical protein
VRHVPSMGTCQTIHLVLERVMVDLLKELLAFLRARKKLWLLPIVLFMLAIGGLLIIAHGSVFAPFIYALF